MSEEVVEIAKEALAALQESEERFRTLCERAPVMIDAVDGAGMITLWNRECERLLGYSFEEVAQADDPMALFYPDAQVREAVIADVERSDGTFREYEVLVRDGSTRIQFWANFRLPTGARISVGYDVTDERRAAEELERSREQLRQSQKMEAVGQLSGGIAHDFNNLLSIISANALIAGRKTEEAAVKARLDEIGEACRRGAELVRKLMRFSRSEALQLQAIDLATIAREFLPTLRRLLPQSLTVTTDFEAGQQVVLADRGAIEQILINLATNARDATGGTGTLRISTGHAELSSSCREALGLPIEGEIVELVVTDDGPGMDAESKARAFEPFYTTKEVGRGTGLGLAMVYGLVQQHCGGVRIDSEPGSGTAVRVYLPLASGRAVRHVSPEPAKGPVSLPAAPRTLLLVEDEDQLREAVTMFLEDSGYTVIPAADGQQALDIYLQRHKEIDCIVSDDVMPNLSGTQLYGKLVELGHNPPFLLTTGHLSESGGRALELETIFKPWDGNDLLARLDTLLD